MKYTDIEGNPIPGTQDGDEHVWAARAGYLQGVLSEIDISLGTITGARGRSESFDKVARIVEGLAWQKCPVCEGESTRDKPCEGCGWACGRAEVTYAQANEIRERMAARKALEESRERRAMFALNAGGLEVEKVADGWKVSQSGSPELTSTRRKLSDAVLDVRGEKPDGSDAMVFRKASGE